MLGQQVSYDHIPYFYSDQYDVGMEYSGYAPQWDEVVFRGDRAGGEFIAFWLRDGRVTAGMNVNVWDVNEDVQALIRSRQQVVVHLGDDSRGGRVVHLICVVLVRDLIDQRALGEPANNFARRRDGDPQNRLTHVE